MIDEKKLIEERPEYLNPCHESHGEYNKGWNACNDMWFDLVHEQPKVDVTDTNVGNKWIPCSKELPSESGYYFACIHNSDVDDFDFRKTWFAHKDDYDIEESEWRELYDYEKVTAWQPLPKPYEED